MNFLDRAKTHYYTPAFRLLGFILKKYGLKGRIAQLGEHRPYKPGVTGSSPVSPTSVPLDPEYTCDGFLRKPFLPERKWSFLLSSIGGED